MPIQATWSNKAMREGHSPCQPDPFSIHFGVPFYSIAPLGLESINVTLPDLAPWKQGLLTTKGYQIHDDNTVDFEVGFFSDTPLRRPWTLVPLEGNPVASADNKRLNIALGPNRTPTAMGQNGDKVTVHVEFDASKAVADPRAGILVRFREILEMGDAGLPVGVGGPNALKSFSVPILLAPPASFAAHGPVLDAGVASDAGAASDAAKDGP
jgi:hypothetical protein